MSEHRDIQDRDELIAELHEMAAAVGMQIVPYKDEKPPEPPPQPTVPQYIFRGNVSTKTAFQIVVTGPCGAKEFRKLIKLLETQAEVLDDDEPRP